MNHSFAAIWRRRTYDKIMSNWFLAARRDNYLAATFFRKHLDLFCTSDFRLNGTPQGMKRLSLMRRVLNRNSVTAEAWASPFVIALVRSYPYFIFHYHFARVVRQDKRCREIWTSIPDSPSRGPLAFHKLLRTPIQQAQIDDFESRRVPLFKLIWRVKPEDVGDDSVLHYILTRARADVGATA
jgi:hypothetical protein